MRLIRLYSTGAMVAVLVLSMADFGQAQVVLDNVSPRTSDSAAFVFGPTAPDITVLDVIDDPDAGPVSGFVGSLALLGQPLDVVFQVDNQDLDGVGGLNDTIFFTLSATANNAAGDVINARIFNQGHDAGFGFGGGNNSLTLSVNNVSANTDVVGTTVFDGFTEAFIGAGQGGNTAFTNSVNINGTTVTATYDGSGANAFNFAQASTTFATPQATLLYDSASITGGSLVARQHDFQFSFTPGSNVLLGDVDLSGTVDFSDIGPFIAVLAAGTPQPEADCDENGTVDFSDIGPFIAILSQ